ncbi:MAG: hypothetical protein CMA64_06310 [Euryarchaeota archaeon]|nr:hypothetical protein [Euryarchaeota archaeon]
MRFIKASTTTRGINADTRGLNIDSLGLIELNTDKAMILPKGTQNQRPFTPAEGMVRYNTDTSDFEVYQNSAWKPIRFREPTTIVQQNLGNGNGTETTFGPLDSGDTYYPVPISENNILVTIENVFQLATTNYTLVQNPSSGPGSPYASGWYIVFGTAVPNGKPVQVLHNFDK